LYQTFGLFLWNKWDNFKNYKIPLDDLNGETGCRGFYSFKILNCKVSPDDPNGDMGCKGFYKFSVF